MDIKLDMYTPEYLLELTNQLKTLEPTLQEIYELTDTITNLKFMLNNFKYNYDATYYNKFLIEKNYFLIYGASYRDPTSFSEYVVSFKDFCNTPSYINNLKSTITNLKDDLRCLEVSRIAIHNEKEHTKDLDEYNRLKKKLGK